MNYEKFIKVAPKYLNNKFYTRIIILKKLLSKNFSKIKIKILYILKKYN